MSDLFGNYIVGFPTRRLICMFIVVAKVLKVLASKVLNAI